MKKLIAIALFPALVWAQHTKGIVKDSLTDKPIAYASIWVEDENIGVMADSLGQYAIKTTNANKTIVFSAVGYYPKTVKLPETRGLKLRAIPYSEATEKPQNTQSATLGDYKKRDIDLTFGNKGLPWMLARKFEKPKDLDKTPFLKSVTLFTDCHHNNMKLSIRLFEVDQDGNPGNDITDKMLITRIDYGRDHTTFDLSNLNLKFPENGIFVAVSWLIISQNIKVWYDKRPMQWKDYDPGVGAIPAEANSTWGYMGGKWKQLPRNESDYPLKSYRNKFVELAMKLTLSN